MAKIELEKAYEASKSEDKIYQKWEESGLFNPDNLPGDRQEYFSIAMPPPNVTGILHLGHALENSLLDTQIRYQRMLGKRALLVPGTDHAAVATQARVEGDLKKQGMANPRQELGREGLLAKIREYAENSKSTILNQIRKMGTSCDWSRLAYTFDEPRSEAVNEIFRLMYEDGLIYRGYRVINWSVKGQSTCSDDELEYVDQKTKVYTFKYSADFPISIATTRPETKLGDTAVAINPNDERYQKYIGQKFTVDVGAKNPLTITIIGDENVDINYGTGAVGVTPAHSQIDFEMYQKNKEIGLIQVIGRDGKMTEEAGKEYVGLGINEAREKFVAYLQANNLLEKEEEITNSVGTSDRFGDIVEALPMEQWFIDVNKQIASRGRSLKELMREAVTVGHNGDNKKIVKIEPDRFQNVYLKWIDNLRDWNISRQIWWGHQIPIWYCDCGHYFYSSNTPDSCPKCNGKNLKQDEDTLDTWFSSGTWTFSTLGWPSESNDLLKFHPTSWMQMGYEILFFWMARMILMSTYALDDIPFKEAYIHGILRDKNGKKFSKSLGNGLDPIEMINKYGTDALRLSLLKGTAPGNDARFYEEKIEGTRNFVNKLWNISRYILQSVESAEIIKSEPESKTLSDQWILSQLNKTIDQATKYLNESQFSLAIEVLTDFTWNDFADWYLEIAKIEGDKNQILLYILQNLMKVWHPFCPFITEEIWSNFNAGMLMIENWPTSKEVDDKLVQSDFSLIKNIVSAIRNLRSENKIEPAKRISAIFLANNEENKVIIESQREIIEHLARLNELTIDQQNPETPKKIENAAANVIDGIEIYLPLEGLVDLKAEAKRLTKEIEEIEKYCKGIEAKLSNQEFVANAPAAVVNKEKQKLAEGQEKLEKLRNQLATFN